MNDLRGMTPRDQFEAFHWGIRSRGETQIEVAGLRGRQRVILLGELMALHVVEGRALVEWKFRAPYLKLVSGADDQQLYFAGSRKLLERLGKSRAFGPIGSSVEVRRIDYLTRKGVKRDGKKKAPIYFFHDHEPPYPRLEVIRGGLPRYRGGSYRVLDAGIEG